MLVIVSLIPRTGVKSIQRVDVVVVAFAATTRVGRNGSTFGTYQLAVNEPCHFRGETRATRGDCKATVMLRVDAQRETMTKTRGKFGARLERG